MLEISDLTVSYGPVDAVRGVSLDLERGCIALLGPNGAGKTSTLRAISRLTPSRGRVIFDGHDLQRTSAQRLARMGLIHVPEGRRVFPTLTVHENLQVGQTATAGRRARHTIDEVYDLFPALRQLRDREGWSLSGGELQMVAIGRALLAAPRLLMLDEPSLGLAPIVTKVVYAALREVTAAMPVLLVEQNTSVALELSDRAIVMVGGEFVMSGRSSEMQDREGMMAAYLGHTHDAPRGQGDGETPQAERT